LHARLVAALAVGYLLGTSLPANAQFPAALGEPEGDVIWVDFWASWCAPCRRSFPWLNEMQRRYGPEGLQVIGVNVDKERELADEFLAETPADFTISFDPEGRLAETFEVQAMPSSFLIDRSGNILARHYGFRLAESEEYELSITTALAEAARSNPTE
jgi:cytochrome c biogenesis protein CcmG/thiol:disulfide interchange protein DsbE